MKRQILAPFLALSVAVSAAAAPAQAGSLAERGCAALSARVAAVPGSGPLFLASWEGAPEPALNGAAFTYDNALAVIALSACGQDAAAKRVGEALLAAATTDRAGKAGRLRNTYRAGALSETPPPPHGWWDAAGNHWAEDPYEVGTASGNVAWAGLALLTLAEKTGERKWRDGAEKLGLWLIDKAERQIGYTGGFYGDGDGQRTLTWMSTEHNADIAAFLLRLGQPRREHRAMAFLAAQWEGERFLTGTLPDNKPNRTGQALDAQLLPLLLSDAEPGWSKALDTAEKVHGVPGGFDFNDDRDGLWVEGTALAALVTRRAGKAERADALLAEVARQISPGGLLFATREARITTGLAQGPDSGTADLFYYRRPHLGATAWAVLADLGVNPFVGK